MSETLVILTNRILTVDFAFWEVNKNSFHLSWSSFVCVGQKLFVKSEIFMLYLSSLINLQHVIVFPSHSCKFDFNVFIEILCNELECVVLEQLPK